jgi:hypothetical protein
MHDLKPRSSRNVGMATHAQPKRCLAWKIVSHTSAVGHTTDAEDRPQRLRPDSVKTLKSL